MQIEDKQNASILVVAGESSGDRAAAGMVAAINRIEVFHWFGIGGEHLNECGVELLAHIDDLAAVGLVESFKKTRAWAKAWVAIRKAVQLRRPSIAVLVDAPEVNLPLARVLKQVGVKVIQYVGPQVWAWRSSRLAVLKERVDYVGLVLPFEVEMYQKAGVAASYVGHPLLDAPQPLPAKVVREMLHVPRSATLLALLPGSREGEIARHGEPLIEAGLLCLKQGMCPVFAPLASSANDDILERARSVGMAFLPEGLTARDLLAASDVAIVASGTATLEAALLGVPMVVVYKLDKLSYAVAKKMVKIPYVSLPNWIAGESVVPEFLQDKVQGKLLADQVMEIVQSKGLTQKNAFKEIQEALGGQSAAETMAQLVLRLRK